MQIRSCESCGRMIRRFGRSAALGRPCPYCKAEPSADFDPFAARPPSGVEWAAWGLGLLTEVVGILLPSAVCIGYRRLSMSQIGAGLSSALLAVLLISTGRVARIGSPGEDVRRNLVALLLLHGLILYGAIAFPPLDALGGSFMAIVAAFCIIVVGGHDGKILPAEKAAKARSWSWFILIGFFAAYVYDAGRRLFDR